MLSLMQHITYAQDLPVACGGGRVSYGVIGDNGYSTFYWEVTGGTIVHNYNDSIVVQWNNVPGAHFITVTETSIYGCEGEPYQDTIIVTTPYVDIGLDAQICEGEDYEFIASGADITSYLWQDNTNGETLIATAEGDYWVRVQDQYGCVASDTASLVVHNIPEFDLGSDTLYCGEDGLLLDVTDYGISYEWFNGDITSTYTAYTQTSDQEIWVNVTNEYGCVGSDTIVVRFCGDLQISNAFTPNDDGSNDKWEIEQLFVFDEVTIDVYNRWGERVFHSTGYSSSQFWDGTNQRGQKLPMDSYYYVIDLHNGEEPIVGTVTIIR
jgi:gliding motility-associated-like protein